MPDDLAIVGVDNQPDAAHYWPPLTSVRQRLLEGVLHLGLCRLGIRLLMRERYRRCRWRQVAG